MGRDTDPSGGVVRTVAGALLATNGPSRSSVIYRLSLIATGGRVASIYRFRSDRDEDAISAARAILPEAPSLIGFDLWAGPRQVIEEGLVGISRPS
jgi:hypothetical protein